MAINLIATPAIYGHFDNLNPVYDPSGETIILRKRGDDRQMLDYTDTKQTRDFRNGVTAINEMLASIKIDAPDGIKIGEHHLQFGEQIVRTTPGNDGRRIFTGNWSQHGRFYCWPQNIPSAARATMTINGEAVREPDFSAMHPTMLYCRIGQKLDGDPYDVGGGYERHEVKLGMVIAINAKNRREAVSALAENAGIAKTHAFKIIEAILGRHKAIERSFCSDAGIDLMNLDSQIMMTATSALMAEGIPSVPVHDSIIVPAQFALPFCSMIPSRPRMGGVVPLVVGVWV
jgi:hypothetical protein